MIDNKSMSYSMMLAILLVWMCWLAVPCGGSTVSCVPSAGHHCNYTGSMDDLQSCSKQGNGYYAVQDDVIRCVNCYIADHCVDDNACMEGTTGPTCEKCIKQDSETSGYYRVGSSCVPCQAFPFPVLGTLLLGVITTPVVIKNGLTVSIYTKLKQLMDFLQLVVLSANIRVLLPDWLAAVYNSLSFSFINEDIFTPECVLPSVDQYYLPWVTIMLLPAFIFIIWKAGDTALKKKVSPVSVEPRYWRLRIQLRRGLFLLLLAWYSPLTISTLHSQACAENIPMDLVVNADSGPFLYDQDKTCKDFIFQTLSFLLAIYFLILVLIGPLLLLFITLMYRKWNMLQSKAHLHGPLYSHYRQKFCYWEIFPLLRKLACITITEIYPFPSLIQSSMMLTLTLLYGVMCVVFRPYKRNWWPSLKMLNIHNAFEVYSNITLAVVQLSYILHGTLGADYADPIDYVCVILVFFTITVWIILLLFTNKEMTQDEVEEYHMPEIDEEMDRETSDMLLWDQNKPQKALNF